MTVIGKSEREVLTVLNRTGTVCAGAAGFAAGRDPGAPASVRRMTGISEVRVAVGKSSMPAAMEVHCAHCFKGHTFTY